MRTGTAQLIIAMAACSISIGLPNASLAASNQMKPALKAIDPSQAKLDDGSGNALQAETPIPAKPELGKIKGAPLNQRRPAAAPAAAAPAPPEATTTDGAGASAYSPDNNGYGTDGDMPAQDAPSGPAASYGDAPYQGSAPTTGYPAGTQPFNPTATKPNNASRNTRPAAANSKAPKSNGPNPNLIPEFGKPLPAVQASGAPVNPNGWNTNQYVPAAGGGAPMGSGAAGASQLEGRVARLEQNAFGATYPEHEVDDRIDHLEQEVLGKKSTDGPEQRITRIEAKLGITAPFGGAPAQQRPAAQPPAQRPSFPGGGNQIASRPPVSVAPPGGFPAQGGGYQPAPFNPVNGGFPPSNGGAPQVGSFPPQNSGFPPQNTGSYQPAPFNPVNGGFPPQNGGFPPQNGGFPPQNGSFPPQNNGFPPQGGGYSQGGFPPQQGGYQQPGGFPPQQQPGGFPPQSGFVPQQGGYPTQPGFVPPSNTSANPVKPATKPAAKPGTAKAKLPPGIGIPQAPPQVVPGSGPAEEAPLRDFSETVDLNNYYDVVNKMPSDLSKGEYFSQIRKFDSTCARWSSFPIKVHLPVGSPPNWNLVLQKSVKRWGQYIPFRAVAPQEQADIEVAWINHLPPRQLGLTNLEIFNGRMRVTVYLLRPTNYGGIPEKALQDVALHQLGHALGIFGHSNNLTDIMQPLQISADPKPVMKSKFTGITVRDVNTLKKIYESSGLPDGYQSPQPVVFP